MRRILIVSWGLVMLRHSFPQTLPSRWCRVIVCPSMVPVDRAAMLRKQFNLADKARRKANRLIGVEQQRVAIARALANEPAVLLADEPTGNLDRRNGELVAEIFAGLASAGQTIVMVTHDM